MQVRSILTVALTIASLQLHASTLPTPLLGKPVTPDLAQRTVVITPATTYVSVVSGETVKFVIGDKAITWHFDGPEGPFNFAQIVPPGTLTHSVRGRVATNPLYHGSL